MNYMLEVVHVYSSNNIPEVCLENTAVAVNQKPGDVWSAQTWLLKSIVLPILMNKLNPTIVGDTTVLQTLSLVPGVVAKSPPCHDYLTDFLIWDKRHNLPQVSMWTMMCFHEWVAQLGGNMDRFEAV